MRGRAVHVDHRDHIGPHLPPFFVAGMEYAGTDATSDAVAAIEWIPYSCIMNS